MTTETVRSFVSQVTVGNRDYTTDIAIEISMHEPFFITVSAHYDGLIVESVLETVQGDIRDATKEDDCLRLVRENNMIPKVSDDLAVAIGKKSHLLL